jgi:pilus assembly protein FimV
LRSTKFSKSSSLTARSVLSAAIAIAFSAALIPAHAAGLGRLSVQSALGQPLRAEVEVTALANDEVGNVTAKLASQEAFKQAGLEFNPALQGLRFSVDKRADGRHFVRISSTQPINEPFVDLMVELNWPAGRFVREYTFLLDPADLKQPAQTIAGGDSRAEPIVAPALAPLVVPNATSSEKPVATARDVAPVEPAVKPSTARKTPAEKPAVAAPATGNGDLYNVKRGDTLAGIAARYKTPGVTLEQAAVAIYRANPDAFIGNVNRLKAGASLSIPDQTAMGAVSVAEARTQIRVRSGNFAQYKKRLAGAARPAKSMAKAGQSASGAVGGQVIDSAAGAKAADQVKLSKGNGKGTVGGNALGSASAAEAKIAQNAALKEANDRISALNANIAKMDELAKIKDKRLAELEAQVKANANPSKSGVIGKSDTVAVVPAVKPDPKVVAKSDTAKMEPLKVDPPKVDLPKLDVPKVDATKVIPPKIDSPKADLPKVDLAKADLPKADVPKTDVPTVDAVKTEPPKVVVPPVPEAVKEVPKPVVKPVVPAVPVAVAEKGILDTVTSDYPYALPGLGGLALLGGGYALWAMRRRNKTEKFEDSLIEAEAFSANSLFGTTGGQTVDTSAAVATVSPTRGTETGVEVGSTEVDPIAEAEVYIAYGREGQAEEILKEALRKQNDRQAIRMKLLEIYAGRKDAAAFQATAQEMYDQTRGRNEEWPKVVTLGMSIDPANSLYTGNPAGGGGTKAAGIAAGVAGLAAGAAGLAHVGKNAAGSVKSGAMDSLQAASQIVPPIPDFMAEQKFADSKTADSTSGLDFDFNNKTTIDRAAEKIAAPAAGLNVAAHNMAALDLPNLDLGGKKGASLSPDTKGMDFSIDLPALEELTGTGKPGAGMEMDFGTTSMATAAPVTQTAAWQEMATKLDLAAAYDEIGDRDGARELLQEVLKAGDGSQQQKAKAMLTKLG